MIHRRRASIFHLVKQIGSVIAIKIVFNFSSSQTKKLQSHRVEIHLITVVSSSFVMQKMLFSGGKSHFKTFLTD